jgi:hypothetical protein
MLDEEAFSNSARFRLSLAARRSPRWPLLPHLPAEELSCARAL